MKATLSKKGFGKNVVPSQTQIQDKSRENELQHEKIQHVIRIDIKINSLATTPDLIAVAIFKYIYA